MVLNTKICTFLRQTWRIQLTIAIYFISFKEIAEELVMRPNSDHIEIMTYDKADELIEKRFESLLSRYQIGPEITPKGSDFILSIHPCQFIQIVFIYCIKIP